MVSLVRTLSLGSLDGDDDDEPWPLVVGAALFDIVLILAESLLVAAVSACRCRKRELGRERVQH